MRKNRFMRPKKMIKNNYRRKLMLKRAHQRVLRRRRMFMTQEMVQ